MIIELFIVFNVFIGVLLFLSKNLDYDDEPFAFGIGSLFCIILIVLIHFGTFCDSNVIYDYSNCTNTTARDGTITNSCCSCLCEETLFSKYPIIFGSLDALYGIGAIFFVIRAINSNKDNKKRKSDQDWHD